MKSTLQVNKTSQRHSAWNENLLLQIQIEDYFHFSYFEKDYDGQLNQSYISGEMWLEAIKISLEQTCKLSQM